MLFPFSLPAAHGVLDDAQKGVAVAGGFLFTHAADVQQLVDAHGLFLRHLPQGSIVEHHEGGQVLLARKALAHRVQGVEQLFVRFAQAAGCGGLCAAGLFQPVGALGGTAAGVLHLQLGFLLGRKAEERLKYMTFYSTTQHCLRGFLLQYFGEAAPQKCGNCSCCLAAEQEAQLQVEYARRRAAQSADRLEKPRRAKPAAAGSLSETDEKLLNALYAVRKRLAGKQNLPAFMVFNDATLREMAEKKPMSIDELLNIGGVGEKKAARYGNAFLRVIEDAVGSRE